MGRMKGAALGVAIAGGVTLLTLVATRAQAEYGPGCGVGVVVGLLLLVGGILGAELFKNV